MKKLATSAVTLAIVGGLILPMPSFAQSATSSIDAQLKLIQDLTTQINALQTQMNALKQQQAGVALSAKQATVEILASMKQGSEGDQVKVLQTLLALDAAIYPESLVTGYYGPATRRAVVRFQQKYGLEGVGFVGPKTRERLNKILKEQFEDVKEIRQETREEIAEALEDAFEDSGYTLPVLPYDPNNLCAIPPIPFASSSPVILAGKKVKLIKTGNTFIYHDGKNKVIITPNSYISMIGGRKTLITPGVRLDQVKGGGTSVVHCGPGNATSTPDTLAPTLSFISSTPSFNSATVSWITNEAATGKVYYATTSPINMATALMKSDSSLQTGHTFNLTGLSASTTYYFIVGSADKKGNMATSSQQSFKTTDTPDTTAPSISAVSFTNVGTSTATITWTTNENSGSKVYYSTATPINTGTAMTKVDGAMVTSHSVMLTGLTPNTAHYFKVESADASNNSSISSESTFTTNALPADVTAPAISAVVATPAATTTQVAWTTNEAATSKVYYGTVTPLVLGSASTVTDGAFLTSHSLLLSGLATSTTYYMVVESKDAANNTATSSESTFNTTN